MPSVVILKYARPLGVLLPNQPFIFFYKKKYMKMFRNRYLVLTSQTMFVTFGETELTCLCMLYFMAAYSQPVVIAADGLDVIRSQFKQNVRERNTKYKWDLRENKWYTLIISTCV